MVNLGIDAFCWHARVAAKEVDILDILDVAAELEVPFVQTTLDYVRPIPGGADAVVARAEQHGIKLQAHGAPIGRRYFDGDLDKAIAAVSEWLRETKQLGSPNLDVHSGVYRPELTADPNSYGDELDFLRRVLHGAADIAGELELELLIENASDFKSDELLSLVGEDRSLPLGIFLDVTNSLNVWEDPLVAIERLAPLSVTGHVKDFALSSNWTSDHYHRRGYTVEFLYPGEGITDVAAHVGKLVELKSGSDYNLSIEGLDSRSGIDDQLVRLRPSVARVRECLRAAETTLSAQ
jgi:sugar phosphate isomerase/epimerase